MEDEVTPFAGRRSPDMMVSTPVPKGIDCCVIYISGGY